jgi:hypothetical protein
MGLKTCSILTTLECLQEMLQGLQPPAGFIDTLAEAQDLTLEKPKTAAECRLFEQLSECTRASGASSCTAPIQTANCGQEALAECNNHAPDAGDTEAAHAPSMLSKIPVVSQHGVQVQRTSSSSNAQDTQRTDWSNYCCRYTHIPASVRDRSAATPADLTAANMDKSRLLSQCFLSRPTGALRLLAELQFSFVTFVVGKSLKSTYSFFFEQSQHPTMRTASGFLVRAFFGYRIEDEKLASVIKGAVMLGIWARLVMCTVCAERTL